ncbi:MAG TPA: hypothetical protein VJ000_03260 [Thermodesulfovibrionia bacterium]|nr:hypothetical protein [Thermodesulfovibrionia bacterium]
MTSEMKRPSRYVGMGVSDSRSSRGIAALGGLLTIRLNNPYNSYLQ